MTSDDTEVTIAPNMWRARRLRIRIIGVGVAVAAILLALALASFYVWRVFSTVSELPRDDTLLPVRPGGSTPAVEPGATTPIEGAAVTPAVDTLNYLLLGTDAADGGGSRSDVMILAHVTPARDRVYLISFPRDLWVSIPGHGQAKINAAYAYGGGTLAAETVRDLAGVPLDHVARIDFAGFVALTRTLGGVTVNNRVASSAGNHCWPAGEITIAGDEALAYVRQRYGLPGGDLDRAERQRGVVSAVVAKLASPQILANPVTFSQVLSQLGPYVKVDSGLTNDVVFSTATSLRLASPDGIRSLQVPVAGLGRSDDGQSIVLMDAEGLDELGDALRAGTMDEYYAAHPGQ